jgi:hypothetical protein
VRPDRFQAFALEQLAAHQAVKGARALRDLGESRYPYGVAVRLQDGSEYRWQITAESAPGDSYASPETASEGDPAPGIPAPGPATAAGAGKGPYGLADADGFLAHVITAARSRELHRVRRHDNGLVIACHSGSKLYLRRLPDPSTTRR